MARSACVRVALRVWQKGRFDPLEPRSTLRRGEHNPFMMLHREINRLLDGVSRGFDLSSDRLPPMPKVAPAQSKVKSASQSTANSEGAPPLCRILCTHKRAWSGFKLWIKRSRWVHGLLTPRFEAFVETVRFIACCWSSSCSA